MEYGEQQAIWKAIGALESENERLEEQNEKLSGQIEVLCELRLADVKQLRRLALMVFLLLGAVAVDVFVFGSEAPVSQPGGLLNAMLGG